MLLLILIDKVELDGKKTVDMGDYIGEFEFIFR
jgi:hypothetical protein